jgi:hypothetical protein
MRASPVATIPDRIAPLISADRSAGHVFGGSPSFGRFEYFSKRLAGMDHQLMRPINASAAPLLWFLICVELAALLGLAAWLLALRLYIARLLPLALGISACAVSAVVTLVLARGIARYARRHRFRYSLRTQLLLVAMLGLGLGLLLGGRTVVRPGLGGKEPRRWFDDSGNEITAAEVAYLFDPFYCGCQAGHGLGPDVPR